MSQLSRQDAFERMVLSMYEQGQQASTMNGACKYRTDDGRKCAVGQLIPDEKYRSNMEGSVDGEILESFDARHTDLGFYLRAQMSLHDAYSRFSTPVPFRVWLKHQADLFAKENDLTMPVFPE